MPSVMKCVVIEPDLALRRPDGSGEIRFKAQMELSAPFSVQRGVFGGMTEGAPWIVAYGATAEEALRIVMQKLGEIVSAMMDSELHVPAPPGAAPDVPEPAAPAGGLCPKCGSRVTRRVESLRGVRGECFECLACCAVWSVHRVWPPEPEGPPTEYEYALEADVPRDVPRDGDGQEVLAYDASKGEPVVAISFGAAGVKSRPWLVRVGTAWRVLSRARDIKSAVRIENRSTRVSVVLDWDRVMILSPGQIHTIAAEYIGPIRARAEHP